MPTSGIALRFKKFRQRFGITAPRVAVRAYLGWRWYFTGATAAIAAIATLAWAIAQQGEASELGQQVQELRRQIADKDGELDRLRAGATVEENVVQIERTARQQLVLRIKILEQENADLKEDVSLLERLIKECPRKTGLGRRN